MASGNAIRGSRVGAGPMGEAERGEAAPRVHLSYWCSNRHETRPSFAQEPGMVRRSTVRRSSTRHSRRCATEGSFSSQGLPGSRGVDQPQGPLPSVRRARRCLIGRGARERTLNRISLVGP